MNPKDEKAELAMGVLAARRGDLKAAYADDSRALQLEPNDSDACTELAKVLIQMDRKDEARQLLDVRSRSSPRIMWPTIASAPCIGNRERQTRRKQEVDLYLRYRDADDKLEKSSTTCGSPPMKMQPITNPLEAIRVAMRVPEGSQAALLPMTGI